MTKRTIVLLTGCLFIAGGLFWGAKPAAAQGKAPLDVVHAMTHDVSPPLDKIPVILPSAGPTTPIPLRRARPFQATRATQQDSVLQGSPTSTSAPASTGQNFLGVGSGLANFTVQYIPPDTNGAAGDTQFVQWVNASFAVFDKSSGNVTYGPVAGNTLWSGMGGKAGRACSRNNSGDPIAQYDKQAGRWVMMQPVFQSPYYLCVAVSTTSDVMGSWYRYAIPIPTGYFPDYPKLAVWNDAYYVTYNQFQGNSFLGAAACALDRSSMLVGNNATMQCINVNPNYGSLLPADLDGSTTPPSGSPEYVVGYDSNLQSLDVWQFTPDFATPANTTLTGPSNIAVAPFAEACGGSNCIPQKGTSQLLDSLGDRLMYRVAYRNFGSYQSMLIAHSVDTGSSSGNTGIRWYELQNSGNGFVLSQQGTYAPDSSYRWMPSIAQDQNGDIAMGYSVSGSNMSPTIRYTGRVPGDNAGTMEGENDILSSANVSSGSQTGYARWGDYSSMALDPNDDCTFWYTTEYQPKDGNAWSTRIASFAFPGCSSGTSTPVLSSVSLSPTSVTGGTSVTGTVTLSAAAPSGGLDVGLSSDSSAAQVPSKATVAAGSTSATFQVTTSSVSTTQSATITASYGGVDKTATLTVNAATSSVTVSSLTLNPTSVTSGSSSTGTVTLGAVASGDVVISLTSSDPAASVPGPVTVLSGSQTANFTVTTSSVTTSTTVTITGSYNSSSASGTLTVNPASGDFSLSATPGNVTLHGNGGTATYSVTVTPSGGFNQQVDFSMTSSPGGPQATFSPQSVTGSGTTTMTVTPPSGKASYTLTIIGSVAGVPTHSITVGLKVR